MGKNAGRALLPADQPVRVGIAGFGMSGQVFHAPFLDADPRFRIVKVFERSTEHARAEYPYVRTVRSFGELLGDDIDLVVLCTPNAEHLPMALEALAAGKHVITEKPAAAAAAEADEMRAAAERAGRLFTVFQNRRFDGDFRTVRKLIGEGALGDVVDYEAHYDRFVTGPDPKSWRQAGGRGVGILYDLGVHLIDQAYALFGMPEELYADFAKQRPETPGPDRFTVTLYYASGLRAVLSAGEVAVGPGPHFAVHGTKGSFLKYGMDPQEAALQSGKRPPRRQTDCGQQNSGRQGCGPDGGWGADDPALYGTLARVLEDGSIAKEKVPTVCGDYGLFYDGVFAALTEGAPPPVAPAEAADVLRILEASLISGEAGRRVSL